MQVKQPFREQQIIPDASKKKKKKKKKKNKEKERAKSSQFQKCVVLISTTKKEISSG